MIHSGSIVDKYLDALDLSREQPTHGFLCQLLRRHTETFPMSSVLPCLGTSDPMHLDTLSLFNTIVRDRRGGYCFQQNKLLFDVLVNLNFKVRLVLARVTHNKKNFRPGLTHRISLVHLEEGTFVADVAFGEKCPPVPIPLDGEELNVDWSRRFRVFHANRHLLADGNDADLDPDPLHMQVHDPAGVETEWFTTYKFDLGINYTEDDCKIGHFYSCRSPDAVFVNTLFVSKQRPEDGVIVELTHLKFRCISQKDGKLLESRIIESVQELRELLLNTFAVVVSEKESTHLFVKSKTKMDEERRISFMDEPV